jgi:hypothetical protein
MVVGYFKGEACSGRPSSARRVPVHFARTGGAPSSEEVT